MRALRNGGRCRRVPRGGTQRELPVGAKLPSSDLSCGRHLPRGGGVSMPRGGSTEISFFLRSSALCQIPHRPPHPRQSLSVHRGCFGFRWLPLASGCPRRRFGGSVVVGSFPTPFGSLQAVWPGGKPTSSHGSRLGRRRVSGVPKGLRPVTQARVARHDPRRPREGHGGSLALEPHERLNVLLIAHA